jgi:predicted permease
VRQRWLPVGLLAAGLFATNVVARVVVRLAAHNEKSQTRIGLIAMIAVAVVMVGAAFWWARRLPIPRVLADLGVAVGVGCLLSVLIGPFAGGSTPLKEGVDFFVAQIVQYLVISAAGVLFGLLLVMAFGQDWKSQQWKRYAETVKSKPRRVARR